MRKVKPIERNKTGLEDISPRRAPGYKPEPIYPGMHLEIDSFPEMENWQVGKEYEISMKVKMTGRNKSKYSNCGDFEIKEIEADSDKKEKEDDEE